MKIKSTYQKAPKPLLIAFVLLMVVTGVYFVYQSLAAEPLPTGANETILQIDHTHSDLPDRELMQSADAIPFRLYGNGLAICGDYSENDTSHNAQYYSKQLNGSEVNKLVTLVNKANFKSLEPTYATGPSKMVANYAQTITFNTKATSTQVTIFERDNAKPKAYAKVESAVSSLCASMSTPYITDQVEAKTKKIDPKVVANNITEQIPSELEAPITGESIHVQKDIESAKAKSIVTKTTSKQGNKFYKTADGVVQVVTTIHLPEAKERVKTNKLSKTTAEKLGIQTAKANGFGVVRYARFCATDACYGVNTDDFMNNARDFYQRQTGKTFDMQNIGTIYGSHSAAFYDDPNTQFDTIFNEINAKGLFQNGSPIQLIPGFGSPRITSSDYCGIASLPSIGDYSYKYLLGIDLVAPSSVPGGGYCVTDYGYHYLTVAHELGHNLALAHTTNQGQAGGIMGYDYRCTWPACSLNYFQALYLQSHPLFYAAGPVAVAGQVTVGSKPIEGAQIETCVGQTPTTFSNGYFLIGIQSGAGFCIRHKNAFTGVSGYAVSNNSENKYAKTYEYQVAGTNCYHSCAGAQGTWDLANDAIYHFRYAEARALAVKPGSSQGQKLDSWGKLFGWGGASAGGGILFRNWDIARSVALNSSGQGYVLDGFGGLHPFGGISKATGGTYWSGWDIARDVKFIPGTNKGYVLDGLGPLHAFNGASTTIKGQTLLTSDLAKKFVINGDGTGGYVLDGWGGIHAFGLGGNPIPAIASKGPYWPGWDIARSIVINPEGTKGYVLDGFGGITPFRTGTAGLPPKITNGPYWPGWDIARDIVITNWNTTQPTGYVLDGYGGIHKFGG